MRTKRPSEKRISPQPERFSDGLKASADKERKHRPAYKRCFFFACLDVLQFAAWRCRKKGRIIARLAHGLNLFCLRHGGVGIEKAMRPSENGKRRYAPRCTECSDGLNLFYLLHGGVGTKRAMRPSESGKSRYAPRCAEYSDGLNPFYLLHGGVGTEWCCEPVPIYADMMFLKTKRQRSENRWGRYKEAV